jgi:hypothetical protein
VRYLIDYFDYSLFRFVRIITSECSLVPLLTVFTFIRDSMIYSFILERIEDKDFGKSLIIALPKSKTSIK